MSDIINIEFKSVNEGGIEAALRETADCINTARIDVNTLANLNVDPKRLADLLRQQANLSMFSRAEQDLFERILSESCQLIVDFAGNLPGFTERTLSEVLQRETLIMEKIDQVLSEITRVRETVSADKNSSEARFEEAYRRQVSRKLDELELYGASEIIASGSSRHHNLTLAYISLSILQKQSSHATSPKVGLADPEAKQAVKNLSGGQATRVEHALKHSPRLLIRGEAGSGKTTLLQYVAVRAATGSFVDVLEELNDHVPFFIRLRQLADRDLPAPQDFPGLIAPTIAASMPPNWAHSTMREGSAIVMIDGVDEVIEDRRKAVRDWINELVTEYPLCRYIITSRPTAVPDAWLTSTKFFEAELLPMQPEDVEAFVDHWHDAVAKEELDPDRKEELPKLARELKARIKADRALRELATSPLLCAMICAMHRERRTALPSSRIALYESALAMLLHRRDIERKLTLADLPAIELEEKEGLLQDLAIWLLENGWSAVEKKRAIEKLETLIPAFPRLANNVTGSSLLQALLQRSELLRSPIEGIVEFNHKTFQEFLCAKAIVRADRLPFLLENVQHERWREIAVLAAGLANDVRREEFLSRLIELGDKSRSKQSVYYLIGVACLESSVRLSPDLRQSITKRIGKLHPPQTKAEAKALSAAGDLALPLLRKFGRQKAECAAACVRALRLIGSDQALELLEEYGSDKRNTVSQEIIAGWQNFDRERYAQRVLANCPGIGGALRLEGVTTLKGIRYLGKIEYLSLLPWRNPIPQSELDEVGALTQLRGLSVYARQSIESLEFLRSLQELSRLTLNIEGPTPRIPIIGGLRTLRIQRAAALTLADVSQFKQLVTLYIGLAPDISDISMLSALGNLESLSIFAPALSDLTFVGALLRLKALEVSTNVMPTGLTALRSCEQLTSLSLTESERVSQKVAWGIA